MNSKLSKHQLEVLEELKRGAVLHVYRVGKLQAFLTERQGGVRAVSVRMNTVRVFWKTGLIKRKVLVDGDEWIGIWTCPPETVSVGFPFGKETL